MFFEVHLCLLIKFQLLLNPTDVVCYNLGNLAILYSTPKNDLCLNLHSSSYL